MSQCNNHVDAFIQRTGITSLPDIPYALTQVMYHMGQESKFFRKNSQPKMRDYFNQKALQRRADEYFKYFKTGTGINEKLVHEGRVASICNNFADVAAHIASRILDCEVYVLGCTNPMYAMGFEPERFFIHYLNAFIEEDRIRFFDTAVYNYIFNPSTNRWIDRPKNWNMLDIPEDQILWDRGLQREPLNNRVIEVRELGGKKIIFDNYAARDIRPHHYQRVVFHGSSYAYKVENRKPNKVLII